MNSGRTLRAFDWRNYMTRIGLVLATIGVLALVGGGLSGSALALFAAGIVLTLVGALAYTTPGAKASTAEPISAAAGWYPDPTMPGTQRYWDGDAWTEHVAPATPTSSEPDSDSEGLVVGGLLTALLIPIVGFVIGCVLLTRRPGAGVACMVLAVIMGVVWFDHFASSPY